jgi:methylated-DNA-[protein]-cysteine S-methyltransferase
VPLIVGCHRVLGASGRITGYSGGDGLPTKRLLMKLEGIEIKE